MMIGIENLEKTNGLTKSLIDSLVKVTSTITPRNFYAQAQAFGLSLGLGLGLGATSEPELVCGLRP